ncbi:MAG: hypothetical protein QOJ81_573 [Chloroflexota bacterium]|nr:hypothetical protein [Chloroflexota bacterium]
MSLPISPPAVTSTGANDLPAYVSNGLIGLRVVPISLLSGVTLVSGFTGLEPQVQVDAAAQAPYPLAGDVGINGAWLRVSPHQAEFVRQSYDFSCGELTTVFRFRSDGITAEVEVLTLCSQKQPTIALQQVSVRVSAPCELKLRAQVDDSEIPGRMVRRNLRIPGLDEDGPDGSLSWAALGGESQVGIAYITTFGGDSNVRREVRDLGIEGQLSTEYAVRARQGRPYRMTQIVSLVPSVLNKDPDRAATRLVCRAAADGFDALREENRLEWDEHWRGRILIDSREDRWQQLADAAFYYLNSSVHPSAPASTSMYGLAQWIDYHYYYGHVMWDIEFFCVPSLLFSQPEAAHSLLEYRTQTLRAARSNAKLMGRRGLQFPWESGPSNGEESAPGNGRAAWYEDHVSLDVAWAFSQYAHATGDERFLRDSAAPVLYGIADWIASRVTRVRSGFAFEQTMGIAERQQPSINDAFTVMGAMTVLDEAIATAERLGSQVPSSWRQVRAGLRLPRHTRTGAILSSDGFRPSQEKGATPGPLAGIFPLGHELDGSVEQATLDYYLRLAPQYIGSPMLSPLYGVWAAWAGDRALARELLQRGYADMVGGLFEQTLEYSPAHDPDQTRSGPFFANMGGFLTSLTLGFTGIRIGPAEPETWPSRPVTLPTGWRAIEIERAWIRGEPRRIVARHGAPRARIEPAAAQDRRAA